MAALLDGPATNLYRAFTQMEASLHEITDACIALVYSTKLTIKKEDKDDQGFASVVPKASTTRAVSTKVLPAAVF